MTNRIISNKRTQIIKARLNNPCATLQEIGKQYGITKQWAQKILSDEGLPTCAWKQTFTCLYCGKNIGTNKRKQVFCSLQCRHNYKYIKVACEECGKLREYNAKQMIWRIKLLGLQNHFFCSKVCNGRWFARNYGFGTQEKELKV